MKNIIIIGITLCFIVSSCNKEFLTKTDPTRIGTDVFYQNQDQVTQAVNGVYGQLQTIILSQWAFNELPSDNTTIDYNPQYRADAPGLETFEYYNWIPATVNIATMYNAHYNALFNINNTLAKLAGATIVDSIKNQFTGQLKFLRAYYYFELVQYFGDVVLMTEAIDQPSKAWDYLRVSQVTVNTQIESDLKDAVTLLPVKYNSANVGRITKGAALTLLGKFYLTNKKYADATTTLKQVLPLGYALVPSYADVFDPKKKNGVESIFEVQFQGGNSLGESSNFIYNFSPRLSLGFVTGWAQSAPGGWGIPTKDLIASYETGDLRKAVSIGLDFVRNGETIPYQKKYQHTHTIYGQTDDDWPVLRYADVLLMLAEAINEQGVPTSEAYGYLNLVRQRAGLVGLNGLDQTSFRTKVLNERRVELAFENWRWFDLKRTKTPSALAQFLNAYAAIEKANPTVSRQGTPYNGGDYVFADFEAIYPIPFNEILANSKLTQNTGY